MARLRENFRHASGAIAPPDVGPVCRLFQSCNAHYGRNELLPDRHRANTRAAHTAPTSPQGKQPTRSSAMEAGCNTVSRRVPTPASYALVVVLVDLLAAGY